MLSQVEIFGKVSATLVDVLNVGEEEINLTSSLQSDLGAESIDYLHIVFCLEREFDIKIPRGELFTESVSNDDFVVATVVAYIDQRLLELTDLEPKCILRR